MSYGRSPWLIIGTRGWHGDVIQFIEPAGSIERGIFPYPVVSKDPTQGTIISVPDDAMAQFIAHTAARGSAELQAWIDRGAALDRNYDRVFPEDKSESRWLRTKVQVVRAGRILK